MCILEFFKTSKNKFKKKKIISVSLLLTFPVLCFIVEFYIPGEIAVKYEEGHYYGAILSEQSLHTVKTFTGLWGTQRANNSISESPHHPHSLKPTILKKRN